LSKKEAGHEARFVSYKCIGDDTKAADRQSIDCIKTKKMWRMEFLHPAMWHDHDIDSFKSVDNSKSYTRTHT